MPHEIVHKFKRHKRLLFLKRLFLIALAVVAVAGVARYGLEKTLRVKTIEVAGNERVQSDVLQKETAALLDNDYFSLWPDENILFFSSENLALALAEKFSAIEQIEINRDIWNKSVKVTIKERESRAVWCEGTVCFYADEEGVLFQPAPKFLGDLVLKITDSRDLKLSLGDKIIEGDVFKRLGNFIRKIKITRNLSVDGIKINPGGELWLHTQAGFKLILDSETDFERAEENLGVFLNAIDKNKPDGLDYIDLRFKDRTFYKSSPVF